MYNGSMIKPKEGTKLVCKLGNIDKKVEFHVVPGKMAPLLSADTSEALGLITLNAPQDVLSVSKAAREYQPMTKEMLLAEYGGLFHRLGCLPGEYHLEVDQSVILVKHAPRQVVIPIRKELKKHIEDLEKMKVVKKVTEPTDWISSQVPLMSRRAKTTLPVAAQLLEPEVQPDVKKKLILKRKIGKKCFDKGAKELPELVIGQPIRVKPVDKKSKTWKRGACIGKVGPRSYLVDINGTIIRRNRRVIREAKDSAPPDCSIAVSDLPEFSKSNEEISPDIPTTSSKQIVIKQQLRANPTNTADESEYQQEEWMYISQLAKSATQYNRASDEIIQHVHESKDSCSMNAILCMPFWIEQQKSLTQAGTKSTKARRNKEVHH
eukprot:gene13307-14679_t